MNDLKPFLERSLSSLPISPLAVLLIIVLLTGVMMSFYTIPAESEGIVLRFGKYIEKVPSGLHAKLPFGIDNVIPVPAQRQQKLEFGFATLEDILGSETRAAIARHELMEVVRTNKNRQPLQDESLTGPVTGEGTLGVLRPIHVGRGRY